MENNEEGQTVIEYVLVLGVAMAMAIKVATGLESFWLGSGPNGSCLAQDKSIGCQVLRVLNPQSFKRFRLYR